MSKEKNDDDIIKGLKFIFKNWNKLSPFIRKQIEVRQINSNLNTIILELKAKKNTQSVDNDLKNYLSL